MKLKYKTDGLFSYRKTMLSYCFDILKHVLPAILLGVTINRIAKELEKRFKLAPIPMILIQLSLSAVLLYLLETQLLRASSYDEEWQVTTPGLFFSAAFFGVQTQLQNNIMKVFD
jgi:hypothetical protein